jgi:1-acyl-sn-glycerol-3-phosphate acyltransferase
MGLHNVPSDGPILFVSNHSGALPFDGAMIVTALFKHDQRVVRFLYDRFVTNVGPVDAFYRRVGGVPAARENALELLKRNEQVVIFPEGVSGWPSRSATATGCALSARVSRGWRSPSMSRWCPVAVVGAEEIYPSSAAPRGSASSSGCRTCPSRLSSPSSDFWGRCPFRPSGT